MSINKLSHVNMHVLGHRGWGEDAYIFTHAHHKKHNEHTCTHKLYMHTCMHAHTQAHTHTHTHSPAHQSNQRQWNPQNRQSQSLAARHPPAHCCLCRRKALSSERIHPARSLHTFPSRACEHNSNFIINNNAGYLQSTNHMAQKC